MSQAVLRRPSWKGSKESLAPRHGPVLVDGMMYRSDSPGPPPPTSFSQGHGAAGSSQRVNPPLPPQVRSVTPPPNRGGATMTPTLPPPPAPSSWDSNPPASTKRYSGNLDYLGARISPVPQGAASSQRGISPAPHQPIIMQSSKFTFPPSWSQGGPPPVDYLAGANRQPPPPYPVSRHSPTDQQQAPPPTASSSPSYVNGSGPPPSMLVSNRNSHNLDVYNLGPPQTWSQAAPPPQPPQEDLSPSWQHHHPAPARSNSFSSHPLGGRGAGSQPSPTTVTAVTQAPVLQPVKSTRVQKPELHTAVAPAHPPWMQQQQQTPPQPPPAPPYQEPPPPSSSSSSSSAPQIPEAPSYQGPPPPYPKHLLHQQGAPCCPPTHEPASGREEPGAEEEEGGGGGGGREDTAAEKERKQITTSPVPVRRSKRDEERRGESARVAAYSPQAFKFFMEQHVENILKNHQQRILRRKQLECEMQRVRTTAMWK